MNSIPRIVPMPKAGVAMWVATIVVATLHVAPASSQQPPVVYPARGQSASQQQKDQGECRAWATQSTGIDPAMLAAAPPPPPPPPGGERVRGAARGALAGATVAAITDNDRSDAAAAGAVLGTMAGGRQQRRNASAGQQQAQAAQHQQLDTWNRAVAACLEARGYTVR